MSHRRALRLSLIAAGVVGLASTLTEHGVMADRANRDQGRAPPMLPARDPQVAVREEYEAARAQGTQAALELFIARHGDNALAGDAREELRRLRAGSGR